MALLTIPDEKRSISEAAEVTRYLSNLGIDYTRWERNRRLSANGRARCDVGKIQHGALAR
jgi:cupin superfamily acireductone dioxygenase involved in methionine salvage